MRIVMLYAASWAIAITVGIVVGVAVSLIVANAIVMWGW